MHIKIYNRKLKDLDSIYTIAQMLAQYFPKPDQFVTGIHELLINAVEHGNLGIGFDTKAMLMREGTWKDEVARRLALPENTDKEVEVVLTYDDAECRLIITDQGQGFRWQDFVGRAPEGTRPSGRGLWIAFNSKFDRIMFNAAGNQVTCVAKYCRWAGAEATMMKAA